MLFSATLNTYVKNLAWEYTRDPVEITIEAENITVSEIDQELLHVSSDDKMKLLIGILKHENPASAIIFCNTKRTCEVVSKRLCMNDIKSDFLIGDLPQSKRLQLIKAFKAGSVKILVATDVAARGIDVDDLAMVINYDLPIEAENYVHRIGRTARAGKSGKAYTFCSEQDVYNLPAIERYVEMSIPSAVAFEDMMEEDKSAGVYIKTENWRGDDDYDDRDRRGGYGHGGDGRGRGGHGQGRGNGRGYRGGEGRDGGQGGHGHGEGRGDNYGKRAGEYKKGGQGRGNGNGGNGKGAGKGGFQKKPFIDPEKLAGLSMEERMKLYKEAYGNGASAGNGGAGTGAGKGGAVRGNGKGAGKGQGQGGQNRGRGNGNGNGNGQGNGRNGTRNGNGNGQNRNGNRNGNYKGGKGSYNGKNNGKGKSYNNTKNNNKKGAGKPVAQKAPEKKGFLAKLKGLFGKKK